MSKLLHKIKSIKSIVYFIERKKILTIAFIGSKINIKINQYNTQSCIFL